MDVQSILSFIRGAACLATPYVVLGVCEWLTLWYFRSHWRAYRFIWPILFLVAAGWLGLTAYAYKSIPPNSPNPGGFSFNPGRFKDFMIWVALGTPSIPTMIAVLAAPPRFARALRADGLRSAALGGAVPARRPDDGQK